MYAIINGYGVPKNILTDPSYHAYLGQVFNFLWDHYRTQKLTLLLTGGHTDLTPPYRRTEAGEMARWFAPRIKERRLSKHWIVKTTTTSLSALENLIAARKVAGQNQVLYFCEKTREKKSKRLVRKLFGKKGFVQAIDFDTSEPRYDAETRTRLEQEDLTYSLRALRDPRWRKKLIEANAEKIRVLRNTPIQKRATEIDRITLRVRRDFLMSN